MLDWRTLYSTAVHTEHWFTLVEVTALPWLPGALGHQDVEVSRLADLPEAACRATHTPAGQGAALPWGGIALDQHRVLRTAGGELDLAPGLGAVWTFLFNLLEGRLAGVLAGELEGVVAGTEAVTLTPAIHQVAACDHVLVAGLEPQQLVIIPVLIFTHADLMLRDGASAKRRSYYAPEPSVARPVQTVNPTAALVFLLGADRAAAADTEHHRPGAVLGFLAFRLITGQTQQRPAAPCEHRYQNAYCKEIHPGRGHGGKN